MIVRGVWSSSTALILGGGPEYRNPNPETRDAAAGDVPRVAASQLPAVRQWPDHLAGRHLDAVDRAVVAGVSAHGVLAAAGAGGVCGADPGLPFRVAGRRVCGPSQPAPHRHRHANCLDVACLHPFGTDAAQTHSGLGDHGTGRLPRRGECFRYPGPSVVHRRDGEFGGYDQRHRPEFLHVQRRSAHRAGAGRPADRRVGRGDLFSGERT